MSGKSGGTNPYFSKEDQPIDLAQKSHPLAARGTENIQIPVSIPKATTLVHFGSTGSSIIGPNTTASVTCKPVQTPTTIPHIPRGAAVVANITSRTPNLSSAVRTSSLGTSNSSSVTTAPRASFPGQRFPMASNSWVNRTGSSVPAPSKVSVTQSSGRGAAITARPTQTMMLPMTTYPSGTVKSGGSLVASSLRSPTGTMRIGASSTEVTRHIAKATHITGQQKYVGTGTTGGVRSVNATASGGVSTLYSPTATLVTSLASSGTTITAHPINRNQNTSNNLRISSAITSTAFSQASSQTSSVGGAISLTAASTGGTILNQQQLTRTQPIEHHIPIKTPFVRAPMHIPSASQNLKGSTQSIPAGTQISLSGPKVMPHPSSGASLTLAQIGGHKAAANPTGGHSFQSRSGAVGGGGTTISRIGNHAISMTKVIPKVPHSLGSPTAPPTNEPSHSNLYLHRTSHLGSSNLSSPGERLPSTLPQYSITTPYYVESQSQSSLPVKGSIVHQSSQLVPVTGSGGPIRVGGNAASSEGHSTTAIPLMKPNASPRPTILRKRSDMDGSPLKAAKNLTATLNLPVSSPPSPKRPDSRGTGNASSGSTTISANSSPGTQPTEEENLARKMETYEEGLVGNGQSEAVNEQKPFSPYPLSVPQPLDGVSPRKKPRKQQLMGNELQEALPCEEEVQYPPSKKLHKEPPFKIDRAITPPVIDSEDDDEDEDDDLDDDEEDDEEEEEETEPRRPHMSLLSSYRQGWKARHNHFARHADVKAKEDKRKSVNEVANNKMTLQRVNGWKVMHVSGQVEELMDLETDVGSRLEAVLTSVEERHHKRKLYKEFDKDIDRLSELVKSNIQRSVTIKQQMSDAKDQMSKIFDHKENVIELLTKYSSKRTLRKKDKY